jgi:DNA-directed RNA polymerase subunit F
VSPLDENKTRLVSLAEVKTILKKLEKERPELIYEQRIALEHANKFSRLPQKVTGQLIKELAALEFLEDNHAYKIADLLPTTEDDVKTIFAKERKTLKNDDIKIILELVRKYYVE